MVETTNVKNKKDTLKIKALKMYTIWLIVKSKLKWIILMYFTEFEQSLIIQIKC